MKDSALSTMPGQREKGEPKVLKPGTHLWQKTSRLWCHRTGSVSDWPSLALYVFERRMKWKTRASTTLYGSACFLSSRIRMNRELGPWHGEKIVE